MPFFLAFTVKLLPLYLNILLGYIAGKKLEANQETIGKLMIYIIAPLVIFNGVLNTKLDNQILTLPILTFAISCTLCLCWG